MYTKTFLHKLHLDKQLRQNNFYTAVKNLRGEYKEQWKE